MARFWVIVVIGLKELLWAGSSIPGFCLNDLSTLHTELAYAEVHESPYLELDIEGGSILELRLGLSVGLLVLRSVAAVRFGPVQRPIFPNPGLDLGFSSAKLLNLGLDLRFRFSEVRFRFRGSSDRFEPIFVSHSPNHLKKCLQRLFTTKETTHLPTYPSIPPSQGTLVSLWV
jgi:hypothetical protein